jgi:hypothetical protein
MALEQFTSTRWSKINLIHVSIDTVRAIRYTFLRTHSREEER